MSLKVFMTFVFITFTASVTASTLISPSDINLTLKNGAINREAMTSGQKDSIVIGVFDYEDDFEDIAILHHSLNQIIVYKNLRNGFASPYRILDMTGKNVKSIKGVYPVQSLESLDERTGLKLTMYDGTKEIISDFEIYRYGLPDIEKSMVPKWDIFNDPRAFIYNISFLQKWQSERNGKPIYRFTIGDIDQDGKDELIWTFHKIANPFSRIDSTRLVVFEYVNENQVRLDWDTILPPGGGNYGYGGISDYDNDGNFEFMGFSYFGMLNEITTGFFECLGEGVYRYLFSGYGSISGHPWAVEYRDSVTFQGVTARGMWLLSGAGSGTNHDVRLLRYSGTVPGLGLGFITVMSRQLGYVYHMSVGDLDRDGKEEIVLGSSQWGGNTYYLDSTGYGGGGFEQLQMNAIPPGAAGFSFFKDYDGDGYQELTVAGIGQGSGGLSIMKHVGDPGTNSFQIVYSNTSMLASPNRGIDTNYINGDFNLLYALNYYDNFTEYQNTYLFKLSDTFNYEVNYFLEEDSIVYLSSKIYDLGNTGKMNLITPIRFQGIYNSGNAFLTIFEMEGPLGTGESNTAIPLAFSLKQNYPNPFNSQTTIGYEIHKPGNYSLEVFDMSGKLITKLFNGFRSNGLYNEVYEANLISSGVYLYRLSGEGFSTTKKLMLLK